jgi:hypothetical protein
MPVDRLAVKTVLQDKTPVATVAEVIAMVAKQEKKVAQGLRGVHIAGLWARVPMPPKLLVLLVLPGSGNLTNITGEGLLAKTAPEVSTRTLPASGIATCVREQAGVTTAKW